MSIRFTHPHSLGLSAARREVATMATDVARQLQLSQRWEGDSLRFARPGADGRIDVYDDRVDVDVELSGMLAPMSGMIESQLKSALRERLG